MNLKKNIARGEMNRVADGALVLQTGDSPEDHAHVKKVTPLETKMREMENDERYRTELGPDLDPVRQARTTRLRRAKDVRPL